MPNNEWVDFREIKAAVTIQMVLEHYGLSGMKRIGHELRGPCPIHRGSTKSKHFSVNTTKNAFKCFFDKCGARGNVLDFVAAMENCSVRDAALKLRDWFGIGERDSPKEDPDSTLGQPVDTLAELATELDTHISQIASHLTLAQAKMAAIQELVADMQNRE
jgi:DNA primase